MNDSIVPLTNSSSVTAKKRACKRDYLISQPVTIPSFINASKKQLIFQREFNIHWASFTILMLIIDHYKINGSGITASALSRIWDNERSYRKVCDRINTLLNRNLIEIITTVNGFRYFGPTPKAYSTLTKIGNS